MDNWRSATIGSLIDEGVILVHKDGNHGSNYPRIDDFQSDGLCFLTAKSLSDWRIDFEGAPRLSKRKASELRFGFVAPGDVLLSHNATVGRVAVVPANSGPAVIGTSLTQFRVDPEKLLPGFLALYFSSRDFQNELSFTMAQTTRNQVPITEQRRLRLSVPPMAVQLNIADAAFSLIDKIEANRRMNETLEEMAQAIFRDWFVDFGPVHRKLAGVTDPVEVLGAVTTDPTRASELMGLFPDKLADDGLPGGWVMTTLEHYATLNPESWSLRSPPDSVRYVDLSNTKWGVIESALELEWSEAPSRARRIARRGDTLVGTVRPGNGSYAFVGQDGLTASTGFAQLRPKAAHYEDIVYSASTNRENIDRLTLLADGGAYPAVNPALVLGTTLPNISDGLALAFAALVSPIRGLIERRKAENGALAETRDYLLPRLMSGEVRVGDVAQGIAA